MMMMMMMMLMMAMTMMAMMIMVMILTVLMDTGIIVRSQLRTKSSMDAASLKKHLTFDLRKVGKKIFQLQPPLLNIKQASSPDASLLYMYL